MIEWNLVAEEERLVGGHGLDHLGRQRLGAVFQFLNQFAKSGQAGLARERRQPAFHQILLVSGQIEAGAILEEFTQKLIVERRHARSPENSRTSFGAI